MRSTQSLVLFAGPAPARAFLDKIATAIGGMGAQIDIITSDRPLQQYPRWGEVDILVAFASPCSSADFAAAKSLRAVIIPSLGYEGIDLAAAIAHGIIVANGQVAENFASVAEAAIMLILMSLYNVRKAESRLREGGVPGEPLGGRMLAARTIGIIGLGNIGRAVISRLQNWGPTILVHTRSDAPEGLGKAERVSLDALLARSDIVVPLLPLTPETHFLLNRARLMQMKSGAVLVNLSRGAVVDEAALADPAVYCRLGAIALDVFETEPLPIDSPLRLLPRAILTGHEIAHTSENMTALFDKAVDNIRAALKGDMPSTALNPEVAMGQEGRFHALRKSFKSARPPRRSHGRHHPPTD